MSVKGKLQRWLDLVALLVGRRFPIPIDEVMAGVPEYASRWTDGDDTARETARRTFERDKAELIGAGIPLETVEMQFEGLTRHGYRLRREDFFLPWIRLISGDAEEGEGKRGGTGAGGAAGARRRPPRGRSVSLGVDEAGLALEALGRVADLPASPLASEARSAWRKLAYDLEPEPPTGAPLIFAERPEAEEVRRRVETLADALLDRKRVRFTYHGIYRQETTEREVEPWGLFFQGGHWYLAGHDLDRDALRLFRAGRMEAVQKNPRTPRTPDYEIPPEFSLDSLRGREAWNLHSDDDESLEARVRFDFPRSLWAERNGFGRLVAEHEDGATERAFEVRQVGPFLRWVLSLRGDAELLEPPELRRELRELAEAVAAAHAGDVAGAGAADEDEAGASDVAADQEGAAGGESADG